MFSASTRPDLAQFSSPSQSPPPSKSSCGAQSLTAPATTTDAALEREDDDVTVEDLLYDAQMDMIAHRQERAKKRLELAVDKKSSAACATLANLYAKGYCRHDPVEQPGTSSSPPGVSSPPSSVSPPVHAHPSRPRIPARSSSWNCHQVHRSPESVKAAELYLIGLEIELEKPLRPCPAKRGRRVREESSTSSEDEPAESKHWTVQAVLDLIVGLTDAHRFGVVQPSSPGDVVATTSLWDRSARVSSRVLNHPTIAPLLSSLASSDVSRPTELSRSMTNGSSNRGQSVSRSYTHPAASIPEPGGAWVNSQSRRLELTVAIHALYILALQAFSSSSPDPPSSASSDMSQISGLPTPDASPILVDQTPISISPSSSWYQDAGSSAPQTSGEARATKLFETILRLANSRPDNRNVTTTTGGTIGIKEGDDLVTRAQRRLAGIRNEPIPGERDWRLAKKIKKKAQQLPATTTTSASAHHSIATGPFGHREEESGSLQLPFDPTMSRHDQERSDDTTSSSVTVTPSLLSRRNTSKFHFAADGDGDEEDHEEAPYPSPPVTPPASSHRELDRLTTVSGKQALAPLDTKGVASTSSAAETPAARGTESLRSPPLASPLQPRYHSQHSQSTTHLGSCSTSSKTLLGPPPTSRPRRSDFDPTAQQQQQQQGGGGGRRFRSDSFHSFDSRSCSPSMTRLFDPSTRLLRRVESSTSVCTVPPDFGATRVLRVGDKGKGKAVDPEENGHQARRRNGRDFGFGTGELIVPGATTTTTTNGQRLLGRRSSGDDDRKVGKNWLSRFFSVSGLHPVRESLSTTQDVGGAGRGGGRSSSSSLLLQHRLRETLRRDEEASTSVEYIMDWGDEDAPTEDEDEDYARDSHGPYEEVDSEDGLRRQVAEPSPPRPPSRPTEPAEPELESRSTLTSPLPTSHAPPRPLLGPRRASSKTSLHSKRSFVLNDPTTDRSSSPFFLSPSDSSSSSSRRDRSSRHRHASCRSSSTFETTTTNHSNFLSPLSAAHPSSSPDTRSSSAAAASQQQRKNQNKKKNKNAAPVAIDPLLLELERSSRVGVRTVCQSCHKKGLNYPACRTCGKCYCSRDCRVDVKSHGCIQGGV